MGMGWEEVRTWIRWGLAVGGGAALFAAALYVVGQSHGGAAGSASAAGPMVASVAAGATVPSRSAPLASRLVEETGTVVVQVRRVEATMTRLETGVVRLGGFVQEANLNSGPGTGSAYLVLRVPAPAWTTEMHQVSATGRVLSLSQSGLDVTMAASNLDVQITGLENAVAGYQQLFKRVGSVQAMLEVQQALSQTEAKLQALQQQRANLAQQVALGTLDVTLEPPPPLPSPPRPVPLVRVLAGSLATMAQVGHDALAVFVWALPWAAVAGLLAVPVRWWRRARAAR
jgi:hypothetical protein